MNRLEGKTAIVRGAKGGTGYKTGGEVGRAKGEFGYSRFFSANRPALVNIIDTIIYPTTQSLATMVHRNE